MKANEIIKAAYNVEVKLMPGEKAIIAIIDKEGYLVDKIETAIKLNSEWIVEKKYNGGSEVQYKIIYNERR